MSVPEISLAGSMRPAAPYPTELEGPIDHAGPNGQEAR